MPLNTSRAREHLTKGNLRALFIEDLGWDRHAATLKVTVEGSTLELHALAQKRGMVAYQCAPPQGHRLPDYSHRRQIEHQVAKSAHEHLIVFTDGTKETQIWQWVKREAGRPAACREHSFHRSQSGDALLQKLGAIAFTLEEEDRLSLPDVTRRARVGFDVERVTKRFYEQFQNEHVAFLGFIYGITDNPDREWYASVMLNRLMFVYFIQRKGFLDADQDYLRNRLARMRANQGKDKFYSFYRYFLLRLFHEGLGGKVRSVELEKLVGRIPYLNGGLFDVHELEKPERYGKTIQIPDEAFERIFDYFDQYQWHLDERPLRADNEINPDVLGYIFEKYINQKQMGAYYTKEDITEYISKNTVLPFLLDTARSECRVAFENPEGPTVWDLLKQDPDRYIYPAMRHGIGEPLPNEVEKGVNPPSLHNLVEHSSVETLELRKGWSAIAPDTHALPTETWREVIARRERYEAIKAKLIAGEVRDTSDLITLNLDTRQFVQDVVESSEGPDLLRAVWHAIEKVSILDPTCGSGAFLFAALSVLEPLYEACLDRMAAFIEETTRIDTKPRQARFADFRKVLERVAEHPSAKYFVHKCIILNNLYGIDIMEEAVEICKLRLFLKLAAQVDPDPDKPNLGIEPLPDLDFNIRPGNALVGFPTLAAVAKALTGQLDFDNAAEKIAVKAADLQRAFDSFRARQMEGDAPVPAYDKRELRYRLDGLNSELNSYLASEYGISPSNSKAMSRWVSTHQPFHWFVEFYGIMDKGFDIIIGNPPYVELSDIEGQYSVLHFSLLETGNLYSLCLERFKHLVGSGGRVGAIVPISSISTPRMLPLMRLLHDNFAPLYLANFAVRPGKLFVGVDMNLTIVIGKLGDGEGPRELFATPYTRWHERARENLFSGLVYASTTILPGIATIPKTGNSVAAEVFGRLFACPPLSRFRSQAAGAETVHYHSGGRYFRKCLRTRISNEYKPLPVIKDFANPAICLLSSSLYYWFWIAISDCYHVTRRDVDALPVPESLLGVAELTSLAELLLDDLWRNSHRRIRVRKDGTKQEEVNFDVGKSRAVLDKIDVVLGKHYQLSEEELDWVMNYDARFRFTAMEGNDD